MTDDSISIKPCHIAIQSWQFDCPTFPVGRLALSSSLLCSVVAEGLPSQIAVAMNAVISSHPINTAILVPQDLYIHNTLNKEQ